MAKNRTFPQLLAAAGVRQMGRHARVAPTVIVASSSGLHLRRQILVREVDQRLLLASTPRRLSAQPRYKAPRLAFHLAQGLAPLRLGFGGDQVMHGFRLHQVEAAVKEGATCEFARFGRAQAETGQRIRDAWMTARPPCRCSSAESSPV